MEKQLFRQLGIPTTRIDDEVEVFPALLKSRFLGYDGKGQRLVETRPGTVPGHVLEERVDFDRELSLLAVRGGDGRDALLAARRERSSRRDPPHVTGACGGRPAGGGGGIRDEDSRQLEYVGVLALELFDVGGELLANEIAPRVHNTGHWTIEGSETSQFENHLRAILGLPLGSTASRPSLLVNLIGTVPKAVDMLAIPHAHLHLYGKEPRPGRKLGHVTLVESLERERAGTAAASALSRRGRR